LYKVRIANVQQSTSEVLASTAYLFEIEKTKFSKNWGKKQPYKEVKDPELLVWFYANTVGKGTWTVKTKEGGVVLNSGSVDCVHGLNSFIYNLDFEESSLKKYRETLQSAQKDAKKPVEIEKADSRKYYLQKGVYTFTLEKGGKTATQEFTID